MKKITSILIAAGLATVAAIPMAAQAADGTITFNGLITAQTCSISGNGSGAADFTVTLPTVSTSALAADGTSAGRTPFSIALSNCSPDSGAVATHFEPGATVDTTTGRLLNAAGSATNVQIGLRNEDLTSIALGQAQASENSQSVAISGGNATLNYHAEYVATGGAATSGTVNTTVMYSLSYQ